ncbi:LacI family DNA-binding transcriptional regulator [Bifidobacterium avesanii]|uniref:LacI family DNA-binding transcriptional regulator n=1 Tax=Bifidobacterium avesanii TaxID=1798157 RepID=A0A7K3TIR0_9BIFI|nr:LacI family DNA-binding transcriptional regulator [Bifidobacterium avesanii]KAB8290326.1 LacI family transcriptional regulator [Bifidobacterium avesanii]NEG78998.1 LacI family DNA-binding transcriptional regulator [Bifidobacterium avesanii]
MKADAGSRAGRSGRGTGRVTLREVAARAGVSIGTVSNYLSGRARLSGETAARVKAAVDELGYVANAAARTLKTGRTMTLTLAVVSLNQPYFAELAEQVIAAADERGYGVIVQSLGASRARVEKCVDAARRGVTDGLIVSPTLMGERDARLFEGTYPLVVLGTQPFEAPAPNITVDNVKAAYDATAHLIRAGRTRIALVGGEFGPLRNSRSCRAEGYRAALNDAGLPFDPRLVHGIYDWNSMEGARAVDVLMEYAPNFDAVLACDDLLALGVMRRLMDRGLRIPDDVRVVGMDDIGQSRYSVPTLTSVDLGRQNVAVEAVDSLIAQAAAGRRAAPELRYVAHRLICRDSSPAALGVPGALGSPAAPGEDAGEDTAGRDFKA